MEHDLNTSKYDDLRTEQKLIFLLQESLMLESKESKLKKQNRSNGLYRSRHTFEDAPKEQNIRR